MSDLADFRAHCAAMAEPGSHLPGCRVRDARCWSTGGWRYPDPDCGGCVPEANRARFAALAAELDRYLAGESGDEPLPMEDR